MPSADPGFTSGNIAIFMELLSLSFSSPLISACEHGEMLNRRQERFTTTRGLAPSCSSPHSRLEMEGGSRRALKMRHRAANRGLNVMELVSGS